MSESFGFWSLLPPILAIALAIKTRQLIFSLFAGLFIGEIIINEGNVFFAFFTSIESIVNVFKSGGNTRTVLFTLLIGALIQLIHYSKGVDGFVQVIQNKIDKVKNPKKFIHLAASTTGFLIFIESNISILTVGTTFRPLFEKYKIAKEKLAYLADSSSAPSCILFPINAWGAYIMSLLMAYENIDPFEALLFSIPFNFYPILTLIMVYYISFTGKSFGLMKKFEDNPKFDKIEVDIKSTSKSNPIFMILPLLGMVVSMPFFLVYTGWVENTNLSFIENLWHSIGNGSGSSAVLYAIIFALTIIGILLFSKKIITINKFVEESFKGMNEMLMMALLMVLAFALGNLCNALGTGNYVTEITESWLSPKLAPFILFLTSCFIAFSTGTSWGTFAIMIPIGIPLAQSLDINIYLALGAILGGGVFGDHCSPISDTTIISAVATKTEVIDHVKTQLPYALFTGILAGILYLIFGFIIN